jgi:dynein heavy chain
MERHIDNFEMDSMWRKGQYVNLHKNLYFALSYLHSVLDGRKIYGPLGWNIYSGFDASDFSISEAQIKAILDAGIEDKDAAIHMIKYLFSNINFCGKISRTEDQRKLDAIIEDLIAPDIANCVLLPPNPNRGHYGFPVSSTKDLAEWVTKTLPIQDSAEIYGFNENTERTMLGKKSLDILMRLYFLNRNKIV